MLNKSELAKRMKLEREQIEKKARAAREKQSKQLQRLASRRAKAFLNNCESTVLAAAKRGFTSVTLDYNTEFKKTLWWFERKFVDGISRECDQELRAALLELVRQNFQGFGLGAYDVYWRIDLVWKD